MTTIFLSRNICVIRRSFTRTTQHKFIYIYNSSRQSFLKRQLIYEPRYIAVRLFSSDKDAKKKEFSPEEIKLGLFQRFKQMYRDYWYVLVPVHLVTSIGWFGSFYYVAKSGADMVSVLQSMGFCERFTNPLKDSSVGHLAISVALYKLTAPLRYTVTLGGTTISINYLKKLGYIQPVPSNDRLKEMYNERRDNLKLSFKRVFTRTKRKHKGKSSRKGSTNLKHQTINTFCAIITDVNQFLSFSFFLHKLPLHQLVPEVPQQLSEPRIT